MVGPTVLLLEMKLTCLDTKGIPKGSLPRRWERVTGKRENQ